MKTTYRLFFLSIVMSIFGCNGILDTEPKDFLTPDLYYNNLKELDAGLTGVYATLRDGNLYRNHMLGRLGLDADQGYNRNSNDGNSVGDYNVSAQDVKITAFWQVLYAGINRANHLLKNIDNVPNVEEKDKNRVKGEAMFLRAYFYFLLVSNFGDVPLILEPITSASKKDEIQKSRTPVKTVYEKIIQDMTKSAEYVDDMSEVKHSGRVTKSAVWGVLSRVCLHVAGNPVNDETKYAEARDWAKKVMDLPIHKLNPNFQQIFINYAQDIYDIGESIWEVEFYGNGLGLYSQLGGSVGINNGIYNTADRELGYTYSYISCTAYTYNVFESGDLRRDWTVAPFNYSGVPARENLWANNQLFNRNCGKFRRKYETLLPKATAVSPQNFPLLRYSDVLLMFAEAENKMNNGPTVEAYEAINKVRRRGFGFDVSVPNTAVDLSGLDYTSFLSEIQDERTRELAFESLRKSDLVRWGIFITNMKARLDEANAHTDFYDLRFAKRTFTSVSARDVVWPIPAYEIGLNPKLTQNTGW